MPERQSDTGQTSVNVPPPSTSTRERKSAATEPCIGEGDKPGPPSAMDGQVAMVCELVLRSFANRNCNELNLQICKRALRNI